MTNIDELYREGFRRFKAGEFAGCIEVLEEVLARDPSHVEALRTIGMAWYRREDHPRALAYGERLVAAAPEDAVSHTTVSLFLMKNGRIEEAEAASARAKVLTWKRQLKEGKGAPAGLDILDGPAPPPTSPPMMPTLAPKKRPPPADRPAGPPEDG